MRRLTADPKICTIHDCGAPRAPGSSWCAEHAALFRRVGRDGSPLETPPRAPAYLPVGRPPLPERPPQFTQSQETPDMTPVNQLCSIVDCNEPHAPNSHLCAKHRAELDRVDQIRKHHMANGNGKPAAAPAVATCCEPGCTEPVLVTPTGRTFKRCKKHHGERVMAGKQRPAEQQTAPVETPATAEAPAPAAESAPEAKPLAEAVMALDRLEQLADEQLAANRRADLEQLIRQTLASNPDAVKLTVTSVKLAFSGEIEISS